MELPTSSSLRFLVRQSPSSSTTPSNPNSQKPSSLRLSSLSHSSSLLTSSSSSSSSSQSQSPSLEGVVVIGFIGRRSDDTSQLINRILDGNVFGSGNLDRDLASGFHKLQLEEEETGPRLRPHPRIGYYYEEEKGIVFLQFEPSFSPSTSLCSITDGSSSLAADGREVCLYSVLEEQDSDDLLGMLVMFSVCHAIIYLTEGLRFDTQILKKFRMLQAAKHTMAPFVKSHIAPMLTSKATSLSSQTSVQTSSSNSSPPARGGGIMGRHASAISLMSGSGSYPSLFPGQCSPAVLFVFLDDFSDGPIPGHHGMDSADASSVDQSSAVSGLPRPGLPANGSSSVVMLARSMSKAEGSFRKKLQSSLEAQIRFLIKKCRTLAGSEVSHSVSRGGTNMSSSPLFSLDASRAVVLLDRAANRKGESLDIAMGIVEEVFSGNVASDILLLENHCQSSNKEDIQSIKEFIHRQSDTLRGRGGLATNSNSSPASGVGMVAVAAAAAAASAASGKTFSTPELPSFENWLSSSQLILKALLSARRFVSEKGSGGEACLRRNATSIQFEGIAPIGTDTIEAAISCLESGRGLNMKFSMSWCERALPDAKEIYLKDLPACYPTSHHEAQLGKALRAFKSMVKGPALQAFAKRLEDECTSIWKSGRQLCDVVSLTGKPCVHQRHNSETSNLHLQDVIKPHSSGFVFLHACACGRSRRLREDPFDFESANIKFNSFPNCDEFLPTLRLPKAVSNAGPLPASSWSLVRVGGARYYDSSKGMLQSGFCSTEKFLFRWMIPLKRDEMNSSQIGITQKEILMRSTADPKVAHVTDEMKNIDTSQLFSGQACNGGSENQRKPPENVSSNDPKISFGRGLPPFAMKRPFSEVVAGSVSVDSAFPPLQQKQQPATGLEKGPKQRGRDRIEDQIYSRGDYQDSSKSDGTPCPESSDGVVNTRNPDGDPFLQIGSNVVPVNVNGGVKIKPNTSLKHAVVYVGFEHECSYGHRFLLSPKHLNELGSLYSLPEESHSLSLEDSDKKIEDSLNLSKNRIHGKVRMSKLNEKMTNTKQHRDGDILFSRSEEQNHSSTCFEGGLNFATLDDGGCAYSLLNRNLPIYMNCPHCKISKSKEGPHKFRFASTISQLQRIFLASCLPPSVPDCERQSQFSLGYRVILPPESFLTFKLPFVYGVQLADKSLHPLNHFEHQPELTAWITKGTTLQVISMGSNIDEEFHM
ncbi:uncharacterized protein LOC131251562 isoform X2 [Magnolia sinica]|uniref:uncharacterized protein LOC131251562 isoform X2 n=1 Tax=Magnolia sinica TaxID=86752 RepID=UPI0026582BF6|nr:uncharacterized protein LOC131251562 isoform X2 [Magnolia sinica]